MKFKSLQENLRKAMWERIDGGDLTGLRLAEQTGFKQAHISNFLNRKRSLSLEGMDRVLSVQHLSILDLLDPADRCRRFGSRLRRLADVGRHARSEHGVEHEGVADRMGRQDEEEREVGRRARLAELR